jgi:hypothetical protein
MHWRARGPSRPDDIVFSLTSVLVFAWLLGAIGAYHADFLAHLLLASTTALFALTTFRRSRHRRDK